MQLAVPSKCLSRVRLYLLAVSSVLTQSLPAIVTTKLPCSLWPLLVYPLLRAVMSKNYFKTTTTTTTAKHVWSIHCSNMLRPYPTPPLLVHSLFKFSRPKFKKKTHTQKQTNKQQQQKTSTYRWASRSLSRIP